MSHKRLPADLSHVLKKLVDPRTGIIRQIAEIPIQACEEDLYIFACECANPSYIRSQNNVPESIHVVACGAGLDRNTALWSAIGESCERFAAVQYCNDQFVCGTVNALGNKALPLEVLILFSEEQYQRIGFPYARIDRNTVYRWVKGENLMTGGEALLPASLVYIGLDDMSNEENICPQISTGLAAGASVVHAQSASIREVVERDAFSSHWLLKRRPPKISLRYAKEHAPHLRSFFDNETIEVSLLWLTTDLDIPCILCLIRPDNITGVFIGMSCDLSVTSAIEKAVVEAFNTLNWGMELRRSGVSPSDADNIRDFRDHVRFYLDPVHRPMTDFMAEGPELPDGLLTQYVGIDSENYSQQLRNLVERIHAQGYHAYYADITPEDIGSLDINVGKCLIPGLQPLHVGVGVEHLDERRLKRLSEYWGLHRPVYLNLSPHPFP